MIENKVKLIIWDLDETFWQGTLEEGGITAVEDNIALVRELANRGIISSICSKNDYERSKAKLNELDIWDYFVFPAISFDPKGKAVADMIEAAGLRPQNVLFIDDNPMNLEEVKFFSPGIMAAHPADVLHLLREHPHLAGKADPGLTRLSQYRFLQRKVDERKGSTLSNEEFLRASNIRVTIDYDVAANFDRVVELINRTNQLNYTKNRLESADEIEQFRQSLIGFGYHAGCIRAADNYGDYGLIGFYLMRQRSYGKKLVHFVFSCRAMHMGIEQYVYEMLDRPEVDIVPPVSYGLDTHTAIDWIRFGHDGESNDTKVSVGSRKLLLLGGCDLLQMTSYCSTNRLEFVNRNEGKVRIRYDDPSFVLSEREVIRSNEAIRKIPCWTYEDAINFDAALSNSELIVVSLWSGMNGHYFDVTGGISVRMAKPDARRVRNTDPDWFDNHFQQVDPSEAERLDLILRSFDRIGAMVKKGRIFVMGCGTAGRSNNKQRDRRVDYNATCQSYCNSNPGLFRYVDVDVIVPPNSVIGNGHFNRTGYFALAQYIMSSAEDLDIPTAGAIVHETQAAEAA
jgi:FkbH-like protein